MITRFPVRIRLAQKDRLAELRLAMLESQLEDLYPEVILEISASPYGDTMDVTIDFATREDQMHWILSNGKIGACLSFLST